MRTQIMVFKRLLIALMSLGFVACSLMPSTSDIFVDQKEAYKDAHELPPLEMPPELAGEYQVPDRQGTASYSQQTRPSAQVKVTPLSKMTKTGAEIINIGNVTYLLAYDSYRNIWRKSVSELEALDYDIEDKNREASMIYLNIVEGETESGMFSSLAFWKSEPTTEYVLAFKQYADGVAVKVQNSQGELVDNDVSKRIYADLLTALKK